MKHIIILGDGMADHAVERLGGKTLLQYANKPYQREQWNHRDPQRR
mgnify:CR=1 FL=1